MEEQDNRFRQVRCEICNAILYEEDIIDGKVKIKCQHCKSWNSIQEYTPELYTAVS